MKTTNTTFILIGTVFLAAWAILFYDALMSMEAIWRRSDTFAHGYFILPISLWLIWRDRLPLLNSEVTFSWWAIPFVVGGVMLNVVAFTADIAVLEQLSAVIVLISLLWALFGNKLTWYYRFPIAFLIFAVPLGENLIPWLQDVTAWITVFLLKIHGIPVFRDGLYIQVPSGMFEVAVACSGIRYLIASVAVGTLYAYLTYDKTKKQVIFILFAIVLPIVANGIRAYLIVIIAHYSDMKYATGADHLVYGWLFFGFVIMLMFWLGGKFADDIPALESNDTKFGANGAKPVWIYIVPLALIVFAYSLKASVSVVAVPEQAAKILDSEPVERSSWGISFQQTVAQSHVQVANDTEYFVAKYGNKQSSGELINFANVLHNPERWTVTDQEVFNHNGETLGLVRLRNTSGKALTYLYQYQIGEFSSVSAIETKVLQIWETLTRGSDYSYVRATAIIGGSSLETDKAQLIAIMSRMKQREK
ncbi:exosortase A [Thalassotalea fusca]